MKTLEQIKDESAQLRDEIERIQPGATAAVNAPDGTLDTLLDEHTQLKELKGQLSGESALDEFTDKRALATATDRLRLKIADLRGRVAAAGKTISAMPVDRGNALSFYDDLVAHFTGLCKTLGASGPHGHIGLGRRTSEPARVLTAAQQAKARGLYLELGALLENAKGTKGLTLKCWEEKIARVNAQLEAI